jgi:hypothetical protein
MVTSKIGIVSPRVVNEKELEKMGEDLRRTDSFLMIGALVFAVFAVILAGSLAYIWVTRW